MSVDYFQFVFALLAVVALIAGLGLLVKRVTQLPFQRRHGESNQLRLAESLFLDPKRRVVRVRNGERTYVLLLSAHGDKVIDNYTPQNTELDAVDPADSAGRDGTYPAPMPRSGGKLSGVFANLLAKTAMNSEPSSKNKS